MKYKLYCDLDGVLTDFNKAYCKVTGIDLTGRFMEGNSEFWAPIDATGPYFWIDMEWMPDGQQLWDYLKRYKPRILSSPSRSSTSKEGKKVWCQMNLPERRELLLYPRSEKQKFAKEGSILIDDMEKTIKEWNERGGIGIHHTSTENTIKELKKLGI